MQHRLDPEAQAAAAASSRRLARLGPLERGGERPTSLGRQGGNPGKAGPLLAALVLHGGVLAALILLHGLAKSRSVGLGVDQSVAVTLVSAASLGASAASSSSDAAAQLQQLQQRLTSDPAAPGAELAPSRPIDATPLSDLIGDAKPAVAASQGNGGAAASTAAPTGGGRGGMADPFALAAVSPQAARDMVQNADAQVQAQAQACWRGPTSTAVRLAIDLNTRGMLTKPPQIKRELFAKIDQQRHDAEARASQAATRCAPYRLATAANIAKSYELVFR